MEEKMKYIASSISCFFKIFVKLNSFTTRDYYTCSRVVFILQADDS